ncbi:MAG: hypothetical protein ABSD97_06225 [Acidimicrobiales bacterium]|jgi:hypothetical protein
MELNDESEHPAPSDEATKPSAPAGASAAEPDDEAEAEAKVEAEIEADVASYKSELDAEVVEDKAKVEKEELAHEYPPPYEAPSYPIAKRESLLRRLTPYLTVAGLLLIARIVVYSLRRRRR